jgi:Tat protein translocase TatB subunit
MLGIGSGELLIIAVILLVAVGPERMPTLMKACGRALREFRKATQDLRHTIGIDELLRDDPPQPRKLTSETTHTPHTDTEFPSEGVDVHFANQKPSEIPPEHD